jgi:hypothetical protein
MQELQSINETTEIPSVFYTHVLSGNAALSHPLRFWSLTYMILQQALGQLDPQRTGLTLQVVRCMPPASNGKVRSLRTSIGLSTPIWKEMPPRLLGAESLAGQALSSYRLLTKAEAVDHQSAMESNLTDSITSAACPIEQASRIAGCLLACSTRPGYFNQTRLALIRNYANLLALAFEAHEFYDLPQLALCIMPSEEVQERYFAQFHQQVADMLAVSMQHDQYVSTTQAELAMWKKIEDSFITHSQ